jgi:hypothetical protein
MRPHGLNGKVQPPQPIHIPNLQTPHRPIVHCQLSIVHSPIPFLHQHPTSRNQPIKRPRVCQPLHPIRQHPPQTPRSRRRSPKQHRSIPASRHRGRRPPLNTIQRSPPPPKPLPLIRKTGDPSIRPQKQSIALLPAHLQIIFPSIYKSRPQNASQSPLSCQTTKDSLINRRNLPPEPPQSTLPQITHNPAVNTTQPRQKMPTTPPSTTRTPPPKRSLIGTCPIAIPL